MPLDAWREHQNLIRWWYSTNTSTEAKFAFCNLFVSSHPFGLRHLVKLQHVIAVVSFHPFGLPLKHGRRMLAAVDRPWILATEEKKTLPGLRRLMLPTQHPRWVLLQRVPLRDAFGHDVSSARIPQNLLGRKTMAPSLVNSYVNALLFRRDDQEAFTPRILPKPSCQGRYRQEVVA